MAEAERRDIRGRVRELVAEAARDGAAGRVREELFAFAGLVHDQPRVRKTLADISVPAEAKAGFLGALLGGRFDPRTVTLLQETLLHAGMNWRLEAVVEDLAIEAALSEATAEGSIGEVEDELFRFARLLEGEHALRTAISDPALPDDRKGALLQDLLGGRATAVTTLMIQHAVSDPGDPVARLLRLAQRAAARSEHVMVEVRVAVDLDDERRSRLAQALSRSAGRPVDLQVVVDDGVVGGVVARVGDELIDGSVRRKLDLAMEQLTT